MLAVLTFSWLLLAVKMMRKLILASCNTQRPRFSAVKILSVSNRTSHLSVISMFWQKGPTTGPLIAERAKVLATPEESRRRNKFWGSL